MWWGKQNCQLLCWDWSVITWVLLLELIQFCARAGIIFRLQLLQPTELLLASVAIRKSSDFGLPFVFFCSAQSKDGWGNVVFISLLCASRSAALARSKTVRGLLHYWACHPCSRMKVILLTQERTGQQGLQSDPQISWSWLKMWVKQCLSCHEMCTNLHKQKPTHWFWRKFCKSKIPVLAEVQCLLYQLKNVPTVEMTSAGNQGECALKPTSGLKTLWLPGANPKGEMELGLHWVKEDPEPTLNFLGASVKYTGQRGILQFYCYFFPDSDHIASVALQLSPFQLQLFLSSHCFIKV